MTSLVMGGGAAGSRFLFSVVTSFVSAIPISLGLTVMTRALAGAGVEVEAPSLFPFLPSCSQASHWDAL